MFFLLLSPVWANDKNGYNINLTEEEKAWLKAHPVIRMGYDPNFPSLEFIDDSGNYVGVVADYIKILNERLGLNIKPAPNINNWPIANEKGKTKELDIFPVITPSLERKDYWLFSDIYLEYYNVIITRDDYPSVTGLESFFGKNISVPSGYVSYELIKNNHPKIKLVEELETLLSKFLLSVGNLNIR